MTKQTIYRTRRVTTRDATRVKVSWHEPDGAHKDFIDTDVSPWQYMPADEHRKAVALSLGVNPEDLLDTSSPSELNKSRHTFVLVANQHCPTCGQLVLQ